MANPTDLWGTGYRTGVFSDPAMVSHTCRENAPLYRHHNAGFSPHFLNSFPWRVARRQQAASSDCPCQFVGDPIHDLGGVGAQPRRLRLGNGRPSGNGLSIPQKMLISLGCRAFATRLLTPTLDKRWHKSKAKIQKHT